MRHLVAALMHCLLWCAAFRLPSAAADTPAASPVPSAFSKSVEGTLKIPGVTLVHGIGLTAEQPPLVLKTKDEKPAVETFTFMLYSDPPSPNLGRVTVHVDTIHSPDGSSVSEGAETKLEVEPAQADPMPVNGVKISLKVHAEAFLLLGSYTAIIRAEATGANDGLQRVIFPLTISRQAASLNLDELRDLVLPVTRALPWGTATTKNAILLPLRETSVLQSVDDLKVACSPITEPSTTDRSAPRKAISGTLKIEPDPVDSLGAGAGIPLYLSAVEIDGIGTFDTKLTFTSHSLPDGHVEVPIHLRVTTALIWPLATVALGVLLGALVNFFLRDQQPRLLNRYRMVKIEGELRHLQDTASGEQSIARLRQIDRQFQSACADNRISDNATLQAEITSLTKALDDFRAARAKQSAEISDDLNKLSAYLDAYRQLATPGPEFDDVTQGLAEIKSLLSNEQVDQAGEKRDALRSTDIPQALTTFLQNHVQDVTKALTAKQSQPPDSNLAATLDALNNQRFPAARDAYATYLTNAANSSGGSPVVTAASNAECQIKVRTADAGLQTDALIDFAIEPAPVAGTEVRWQFGDGTSPDERTDPSHRYLAAGKYVAVLTLTAPQSSTELVHHRKAIKIKRGPVEKSLRRVSWQLWAGQAFVFLISLLAATCTAYLYFTNDKTFGRPADYLLAVLWGLGFDTGVRGFTNVFKGINSANGGAA